MTRGYVKLWRKTLDSGIISNGPAWQLFGYLLMSACHTAHKEIVRGAVFELEPGDVIFSRAMAAAKLGLGEQQIRTALNLLKKLEIVTSKSTNKITIVSFVKWDTYNGNQPAANQQDNQPPNQQLTSSQPASGSASSKSLKNESIKELNININTASGDAAHPQNPDAPQEPEKSAPKKKPKNTGPAPDEPHYQARSGRFLTGKRLESFNRFWGDFDFARGKAEAADAWLDIPQLTDSLVARICDAARQEAADRPALMARGQTPKWAQGWINARRWEDYAPAKPRAPDKGQMQFGGNFDEEKWQKAKEVRERLEQEKREKNGQALGEG